MKKSPFHRRKKQPTDMTLQITALADIFVVLLVFLLKSYSTSITNISPSQDVQLPRASSTTEIRESTRIEVTKSAILVDQQPVLKLTDFAYAANMTLDNGAATELVKILKQVRRPNPMPNYEPNLLVLADEEMPYATLKPILASAALAGFVQWQLVVIKPE